MREFSPEQQAKLSAAVAMIGRCGAASVQIRWSDDEDPVVWFVVAEFDEGVWETAAGRDPIEAALRCAEQLVDGATCVHCGRPTALDTDWQSPVTSIADMTGLALCAYVYDPELHTFRRSCEGEETAA
ncbi:MAG: hypothetical protein KDB37_15785 [Ilumatobacter sp.]|nr:hypothetical protein [Ilumatobacter sp.]